MQVVPYRNSLEVQSFINVKKGTVNFHDGEKGEWLVIPDRRPFSQVGCIKPVSCEVYCNCKLKCHCACNSTFCHHHPMEFKLALPAGSLFNQATKQPDVNFN
jgi:hypothetical protein